MTDADHEGPGVAVRPAGSGDIAALARIARRSVARGFAGILTPEELDAREEALFAARFAEALARMTVLTRDGVAIGFALVTDGHIDMFFLDPDASGRRLGDVLLAALEREGARSLECFAGNGAARRFYERAGWRLATSYERSYLGRVHAFVRYEKPA